jgi:hypothetical protein
MRDATLRQIMRNEKPALEGGLLNITSNSLSVATGKPAKTANRPAASTPFGDLPVFDQRGMNLPIPLVTPVELHAKRDIANCFFARKSGQECLTIGID